MYVEFRVRGTAYRMASTVFSEFEVVPESDSTLISGDVVDEASALGVIDRARGAGLTVVSWRCEVEGRS